MFAPANYTVLLSLLLAAAATCGAVFLLMEMHYPHCGHIQAPSEPLRVALAQLGR